MQKSILPIVLLPSLALALTACGSNEPKSIIISQPSPQPSAAQAQPSTAAQSQELLQQLEKAQADLKALNEKLEDTKAQSPADQPADNTPSQADSALAQKLEKAQNELKAQNAQIEELNKNKQALETQKTELQKQIESKSLEVQASKTALETIKQELETQKASLASQINALKEQYKAENESKIQELQSKLGVKTQELNTVNQNLTQKQAELEKIQKELEVLKAQTVSPPSPAVPVPNPPPADGSQPPVPPPPASVPSTSAKTVSILSALNEIATKYDKEDLERPNFTGFIVSVNNTAKSASTKIIDGIAAGDPSDYFKINGIPIKLLNKDDSNITLRDFKAEDFKEGGFNGENTGFVGSKVEDGNWDGFTSMRFGLYNDASKNSHLFVYGNPAKVDKTKGTGLAYAKFYGSAIISKDGFYTKLPKAVVADIDKDATKVDITIKTGTEDLKFSGDIGIDSEGYKTTFGGVTEDGNRVQGGFFGSQKVVDMGGMFEVGKEGSKYKGEHGVFGASSDSTLGRTYK